jgi:hypothetical protein
MRSSQEINELAKALNEAQKVMEHASKDGKNPHFKSKYATLASCLDACKEPLSRNGLSISQAPQKIEAAWVLVTRLMHTSGQWLESECPIMNAKGDAQGFGSGLTYARRYALSAIIGLAQDDDDANEAVKKDRPQAEALKPVAESDEEAGLLKRYVVTFGKFQGKRLEEIDRIELESYRAYIIGEAMKKGVDLKDKPLELVQAIKAYLEELK